MRIRAALAAAALLGAAGLAVGAAAPAVASTSPAAVVHHVVKPVPAPPPSTPGIALGSAIPAKPHTPHTNSIRPLTAWTVSVASSATQVWPTQYVTITATANMDVGPTPYFIRIYAQTPSGYPAVAGSPAYVATCGTGTTCSVSLTEQTAATQAYSAYIADPSASFPPGSVQAFGVLPPYVQWRSIGVGLSAAPTTLPVGGTTTLTATASTDMGPTPFYIEIYDATTGTFLTDCGVGITCSTTVSQNAASTHFYVAYVSLFGTGSPPPTVQATSPNSYATWSNTGWRIILSGPTQVSGLGDFTATTNMDVGPTPYLIYIYDEASNTQLASCTTGTTCTATFGPNSPGETLVAFVATGAQSIELPLIQASSNTLSVFQQPIR